MILSSVHPISDKDYRNVLDDKRPSHPGTEAGRFKEGYREWNEKEKTEATQKIHKIRRYQIKIHAKKPTNTTEENHNMGDDLDAEW